MTTEDLENKLNKLSSKDRGFETFGAMTHRYKLNRTLYTDEIRDFELAFSIALPEDYKAFLNKVGNGGAGPGYGLFRLKDWNFELDIADKSFLAKPFPHSEAWNMEMDEYTENEAYNEALATWK